MLRTKRGKCQSINSPHASDRCNNSMTASASSRCIIETDIDWGALEAAEETPYWIFALRPAGIKSFTAVQSALSACMQQSMSVAEKTTSPKVSRVTDYASVYFATSYH